MAAASKARRGGRLRRARDLAAAAGAESGDENEDAEHTAAPARKAGGRKQSVDTAASRPALR
jgi:hypothetical protein